MTNKEAIEELKKVDTLDMPTRLCEAHYMAIKALEQEPTTNNDLGVDCILRAQAQTEIGMNASRYTIAKERGGMGQVEWSDQLIKVSDAIDIIRNLPSITPQEPKTGHWILGICDNCGYDWGKDAPIASVPNYCPNCGCRMVEPQESEE